MEMIWPNANTKYKNDYNRSLLPKRNVILQPMMYCNFTTDGNTASQQIHNTCIVIPKKYLTSTVISI